VTHPDDPRGGAVAWLLIGLVILTVAVICAGRWTS
jgi:hypothetical protein